MAAIPWNLCASIPARLLRHCLRFGLLESLQFATQLSQWLCRYCRLFSCLWEQKLAKLRFFVLPWLAVLAVPFHLRKLMLMSCKLSWLSNCFLIWCITESTSIFHQSWRKSLSTSLFRRPHHFWWQRWLMAALLVTRMHSPQNCANKRAEISDVSITNKSLLDFSGIWVT